MKHVGKMKNNSAKIVIVYRTLPGDPHNALVVGTNGLQDSYHDSLMTLMEEINTQNANELAEVLAVRKFPDGSNMLEYFHTRGHLKKVPTAGVLVTPNSQTSIPLNELNVIIAKQKGIDVEDLAVTENGKPNKKKTKNESEVAAAVRSVVGDTPAGEATPKTPAEMRSKADALFKQAQQLRKQADQIDPPKKKTKKSAEVTTE